MEKHSASAGVIIENLRFTYPGREEPALQGVNLTLGQGEFVVLCGSSGCGKTTLLRQLKPALTPHGAKSGSICFEGTALNDLPAREAAAKIGFVMQSPEHQVVTDKVWHELAFGMESLGIDTSAIRLRTAEMASFFGMQTWFYKNVSELSGGQKQLLALASVMALQPSLLLLDEPTSQLDPIAAADFLATVKKINRELGVSVLLTEHRLEEALPLADRAVVMERGRILCEGTPAAVGEELRKRNHAMFAAMPVPMRVWAGVKNTLPCPITVREGRAWVSELASRNTQPPQDALPDTAPQKGAPVIELEGAWFQYDKDGPDIIKGLSFSARAGELTAVLGGNGTGKTTMLSLIAGINRAYRGKIRIEGEEIQKIPSNRLFSGLLGVLPQNPQSLFVAKTVREDLMEILSERKISKNQKQEELRNMAALCRIEALLDAHPYDLSGGEQQRAALAKVLLLRPRILLLDEPTKGLDSEFKAVFAAILRRLTAAGAAVVMVSHDIEFCAEYADRCALFFDGTVITENAPRAFFSGNSFYTSAANRMARHVFPLAVSAGDVICALGGEEPPQPFLPEEEGGGTYSLAEEPPKPVKKERKKLTPLRIGVLGAAVTAFLCTLFYTIQTWDGFSSFLSGGSEAAQIAASPAQAWRYSALMLLFAVEGIAGILSVFWKRGEKEWSVQTPLGSRKLPKRTIAATVVILLMIPLTIYVGIYYFGDRNYYLISMLILLETMLPFALVFEGRKPQARELVILAVLCAIAVAGRSAFFMLPQFKPVAAIVIIAGVAFGGEAGFLVGAMSAFVSNLFFGQGVWTPWQMFAFGIIGFLAGVLFKKGLLLRSIPALCVFGGLATFVIYGGIMNPASVLMFYGKPTRALILAAYVQGIPFDLVHAVATIVFLLAAARPMLEKLDRIKLKYGLLEI